MKRKNTRRVWKFVCKKDRGDLRHFAWNGMEWNGIQNETTLTFLLLLLLSTYIISHHIMLHLCLHGTYYIQPPIYTLHFTHIFHILKDRRAGPLLVGRVWLVFDIWLSVEYVEQGTFNFTYVICNRNKYFTSPQFTDVNCPPSILSFQSLAPACGLYNI